MSRKDKHEHHQHDPALHHPPDIGSVLALARKKKGASLADASKATRLPPRLLQALEENRPWEFPAHVYYRGSLQSYCEYLELDFDALWREMRPEPASAAPAAPSAEPAAPASDAPSFPRLSQPLVIPIAVFALLIAAAGLVRLTTRSEPPPAPKRAAAPPPILEPVTQPEAPKGHHLKVEAKQDGWIRLRVDKKLVFEGRLPSGASKSWDAQESFWVRTPSPGRFRFELNGKEVDPVRFPKDSYENYNLAPELEGQGTPEPPKAPAQTETPATPPSP